MINSIAVRASRSALLASTALFVLCGAGLAQEAGTDSEEYRLRTIQVTALMREQGIQDVPISVHVVDGDIINKSGIATFDDIDSLIPNLIIADSPGNNEIFIRGIGTQSGNLAFEQSVSMFVDGMYGGRARLFQVPFLDIERIEVLRGPQGALVGKNTAAGAISVITRKPTDQLELSLTGDYEMEYGSYGLTGIVSGPVTEKLNARLALKGSHQGGYVYNSAKGTDEPESDLFAARLTATYEATDRLRFTGKLDYAKADITGVPFETIPIGGKIDYVKESDNILLPEQDTTKSFVSLLKTEVDVGDHLLEFITAYGDLESTNLVDASFTAAPMLAALFEDGYSQFSQEIRLISPAGKKFEYIVGGMYLDQDVNLRQESHFNFGPFAGNDIRIYNQTSEVISLFGQGTWNVTDAVRLIGSLRYTEEEKSATLDRGSVGVVPPTSLLTSVSGSRKEDQFDPAITIQWDAVPGVMLYGTFAKGSKGGGFAGASANATAANFGFEPEEAESYEIGAKTTLMDGRANFNIAAFTTEYTNLQVSQYNGVSFDFGNAASAESKGVEMEGAVRLSKGVSLTGALAYLDAKYKSYPGGPCVAPDHVIPGCVADISGARLFNAPEWSGSFGLDVEQDLTENLVWNGNLGVTYRSDFYTHPTLFQESLQGSHAKLDLRLALSNRDNTWEVALVGKNLTDEKTFAQSFETPFSAATGATPDHTMTTHLPEPRRTVALQFTIRN